jgi:hypothetical protein
MPNEQMLIIFIKRRLNKYIIVFTNMIYVLHSLMMDLYLMNCIFRIGQSIFRVLLILWIFIKNSGNAS